MRSTRKGWTRLATLVVLAAALVLGAGGCAPPSAGDRARRLVHTWRYDLRAYYEECDDVVDLGEDAAPVLMILLDDYNEEDENESAHVIALDLMGRIESPDMPFKEYDRMVFDYQMGKGELPEPKQVPWLGPVLLHACKNDSSVVRQVAVRMLPTHVPDCVPALLEATGDPDPSPRASAFWVMRYVSSRALVDLTPAIKRGMTDTSDLVRSSAIVTAAVRRMTAALPALEALLEDNSIVHYTAYVPSEIIWSTVPPRDFEPQINELAAYAIQEITGKDFGFTTCFESRERMAEIIKRIRQLRLDVPHEDH